MYTTKSKSIIKYILLVDAPEREGDAEGSEQAAYWAHHGQERTDQEAGGSAKPEVKGIVFI